MKSAGKARNNGLYRHIRTSKEIIRNLLNDYANISVDDAALNCRLKSLSTVDVWSANHFCSIDTIS